MRNLKKFLALVLAMMMVFSLMITANAAAPTLEDYKDYDQVDRKYATAVDVLTQIGVFEGSDTGNFNPKDTLSRAEATALVYRVLTGDVDDEQVDINNALIGTFSDVPADHWAISYINYAAVGKYVIGDGTGKFNPNDKINGYQLLVILLRAIGYGANNEYTGEDWEYDTASDALILGLTKGIDVGTLGEDITREKVAQIIYNAIDVQLVRWSGGLGYLPLDISGIDATGTSLINLVYNGIDSDRWGVPTHEYTAIWGKAPDVEIDFELDIDIAYENEEHVRVAECDIAEALGIRGTASRNVESVWVNGRQYVGTTGANALANVSSTGHMTVTPATIDAQDTTSYVGGQGTRLEVYNVSTTATPRYRIVIVDTYLAKVQNVTPATEDRNHHVVAATADFKVYTNPGATDAAYTTTYRVTTDAFAKDSYALVNLWQGGASNRLYLADITPVVPTAAGLVSRTAERNDRDLTPGYTTVAGKPYDNAAQFNYYDDLSSKAAAISTTTSHSVIVDDYGNIIGLVPVNTNYLLVEGLQWIGNGTARGGTAMADFIKMDGSHDHDKVVSNIGGTPAAIGTATGAAALAFGKVSVNWSDNKTVYGDRLITYTENEDGTYSLVSAVAVDYNFTGTTLNSKVNYLSTYAINNNTVFFIYDEATDEFVRIIGKANIPEMTGAEGNAYDTNSDGYLDVVVISEYVTVGENAFAAYVGKGATTIVGGTMSKDSKTYNAYSVWNIYAGGYRTVWVEDSSAEATTLATGTGIYYFTVDNDDIVTGVNYLWVDSSATNNSKGPGAGNDPTYSWARYATAGAYVSNEGETLIVSSTQYGIENAVIYRADNSGSVTDYKPIKANELTIADCLFIGYTTTNIGGNVYREAAYIVAYDSTAAVTPPPSGGGADYAVGTAGYGSKNVSAVIADSTHWLSQAEINALISAGKITSTNVYVYVNGVIVGTATGDGETDYGSYLVGGSSQRWKPDGVNFEAFDGAAFGDPDFQTSTKYGTGAGFLKIALSRTISLTSGDTIEVRITGFDSRGAMTAS